MFINQITATFDLAIWLPVLGILISGVVAWVTVAQYKKQNKEKMATKEFVIEKCDSLEAQIREHKADNIREHDDIKQSFHNTIKQQDGKLDIILEWIKGKAS